MRRSSSWIAVLPSLVIPVCLGLIMYLGLAYSIDQGHITNDTVLRYLTGHPVSKVTVGMFFIGLASLLLIANNVFEQFGGEEKITLDDLSGDQLADGAEDQEQSASQQSKSRSLAKGSAAMTTTASENLTVSEHATRLGERLSALPKWLHHHYLWQRLQSGLQFAYRTDSTEDIEDELKYLADLDLDQQQQRYSLVQILIWATPMLGFLGTVLGISQALGGIDVGPDNNLQTMMDGLRGNLYIAFDTTALALTLSMLLMFGQFLVDRFETQLLLLVDQRAQGELNRHFSFAGGGRKGPYQELAQHIAETNRESTEQQTEIWKKTIRSAEQAWASTLTDTNLQVQDNMSAALDENVTNLAHYLGEAIDKADEAMAHRWQQWQVTLSDNARQLEAQQGQLSEQTKLLKQFVSEQKRELSRSIEPVESIAASPDPPEQQQQKSPEQQPGSTERSSESPERVESPSVYQAPLEPINQDAVAQEGQSAPISIWRSRLVESMQQEPEPTTEPEVSFESPRVVNFQSYLDDVLSRSVDPAAKPDSQLGQRGARDEIVLPFRFLSPDDSAASEGQRSDDAA